ncbi:MAG: hypothetical protein GX155_10630 [Smithella sp.]|nr:hypothetical protein [Smithella sp.]
MKKAVALFLVAVVVLSFAGCRKASDEDRVRRVVTGIQAAGEKKDIRAFMSFISKDYHDPRGFNHEAIRALVFGYFLRFPKISVYIGHCAITVEADAAKAIVHSVLTSGEKTGKLSDIVPQSLDAWDFDITLKKEGSDWKVTSAAWKEAEFLMPDET